jgi:hypothetical protein
MLSNLLVPESRRNLMTGLKCLAEYEALFLVDIIQVQSNFYSLFDKSVM